MNETTETATLTKTPWKPYSRVVDWKQERPKLFDLLVEQETAEKMGRPQQCVIIWRNDAPYVLVNSNMARNAANLANYMAAGNVPAETVIRAQRGEDVNLTLDGKAVAELFSPAAAVVRLEDLNIDADELERMLDAAPPTNRTRLYDLVMSLSDDEIVPALTGLRSMRMNRNSPLNCGRRGYYSRRPRLMTGSLTGALTW